MRLLSLLRRLGRVGLVAIGPATLLVGVAQAGALPGADCVDAGRAAAIDRALPDGLLLAVGRVESGRVTGDRGKVEPWPWTIDVAGQSQFFADKTAAVQATRQLLAAGQHNIDVGCFQISLLHHPQAFTDLDQAFDPVANAQFAARFLSGLHSRYGDWAAAVAAYHSADPALGIPYRNLVFAAWHPDDAVRVAMGSTSTVTSVHIVTPRPIGSAARVISLAPQPLAVPLPRIITGRPR